MKWKPFAIALLFFFSCSDEPPKAGNGSLPPIKKDSGNVQKEFANPYASIDISPVDITYFPSDYPVLKMSNEAVGMPVARVIYSRPHKQGRKIFGSLLAYGEPWRLGANEATEIEFFQPVTIQNRTISKGRYIMYAIPGAKTWTVVFNSNIYSWGLTPDPKQDLHRFTVPSGVAPAVVEYFTIVFEKSSAGASLVMAWDDVLVKLPFSF